MDRRENETNPMNTSILSVAIITLGISTMAWLGVGFSPPLSIDPADLSITAHRVNSLEVAVEWSHPDSHRRGSVMPSSGVLVDLPDPDDREAHPVSTLILDLAKPDTTATFASM